MLEVAIVRLPDSELIPPPFPHCETLPEISDVATAKGAEEFWIPAPFHTAVLLRIVEPLMLALPPEFSIPAP